MRLYSNPFVFILFFQDFCSFLVVFQNMSFMWNILIRVYAKSTNHKHHAIVLYKEMITEQENEIFLDKHNYPFLLKVHAHVLKLRFELDSYICNSLIHFYAFDLLSISTFHLQSHLDKLQQPLHSFLLPCKTIVKSLYIPSN